MTLTENLQQLADAVGDECQALRLKIGVVGDLETTDKTNLVDAVNELKELLDTLALSNGATINDNTTSVITTWSSTKIQASIDAILGGVTEELDTLAELAAVIGNDPQIFTNIQTQIDHKVSWNTAAQGLTDSQKNNARVNIGAASATDVGDTTTDFVSIFNQGLL